MPVKTRSQTKMENKNHLIACSVARDLVDEIITKIEEEEEECEYIYHEGKEYMLYETHELESKTTGEVLNVRQVYDDDCDHVGYWINNSIVFI